MPARNTSSTRERVAPSVSIQTKNTTRHWITPGAGIDDTAEYKLDARASGSSASDLGLIEGIQCVPHAKPHALAARTVFGVHESIDTLRGLKLIVDKRKEPNALSRKALSRKSTY